jgi:hypothetical protein
LIFNKDGRKEVSGLCDWIELDIETGQMCPILNIIVSGKINLIINGSYLSVVWHFLKFGDIYKP